MLDAAGLDSVRIIVSGELDAGAIAELVAAQAPIDGFGVGTALAVSTDAPYLDTAYKLATYAGQGRMKLSASKRTWPGRKQVFRQIEAGVAVRDVLGMVDEALDGRPLLEAVMAHGQRIRETPPSLEESRRHAARSLAELPERVRGLRHAEPPYPVAVSDKLDRAATRTRVPAAGPGLGFSVAFRNGGRLAGGQFTVEDQQARTFVAGDSKLAEQRAEGVLFLDLFVHEPVHQRLGLVVT